MYLLITSYRSYIALIINSYFYPSFHVFIILSFYHMHPTQSIEIFGNVSAPFGTLAICDPSIKILRRSSQGNPSVGGLNQREVEKCSDFGLFQGYISETVQDRR